eukprot:4239401-Pyramimonas_sp.AAC.1
MTALLARRGLSAKAPSSFRYMLAGAPARAPTRGGCAAQGRSSDNQGSCEACLSSGCNRQDGSPGNGGARCLRRVGGLRGRYLHG